jgi:hypothetical protein
MSGYTALTLWQQGSTPGRGGDPAGYTLGTQFTVAWPCLLTGLWWYSPPGSMALPMVCGVWDPVTAGAVAEDGDPGWQTPAGADAVPGSGWVRCDLTASSVSLAPGAAYIAAVWQNALVPWYGTQPGYWDTGGGTAGLVNGPLSAPDDAGSLNGQGCYDTTGVWTFPGTNPGNGESHYADPEVTPVTCDGHPAARMGRR